MPIFTLIVGSKIMLTEGWCDGVNSGIIANLTDEVFTFHRTDTHDEYTYLRSDYIFNYSPVCHIWYVRPTHEKYRKSLRERDKERGND